MPAIPEERQEKRAAGLTFGGNLRAAVFGVSDGLVSNTSVSGAFTDARTVLITGTAGVLAGALSMAAGEYVSMRSRASITDAACRSTSPAASPRRCRRICAQHSRHMPASISA